MANTGYSVNTLGDLELIDTTNFKEGTLIFVVEKSSWYLWEKIKRKWKETAPKLLESLLDVNLNENSDKFVIVSEGRLVLSKIRDADLLAEPNYYQVRLNFDTLDNIVGQHIVKINQLTADKQDKLISGTNIKTVNGESILGSGDITISGGNSQTNSTELWLKFNGANNSTDFVDESPNNYLIIPTGNPIISTNNSKFGGSSLYLDGSSFLSLPSIYFKNDWTIECWIKTNATNLMTIISQDPGGYPPGNAWTFLLNEVSQNVPIGYYNYTVGGTSNMLNNNTNVINNQWHHLAIVRNKFSAYLYIDGSLKATYSNWKSLNINNNAPFYIGAHNSFGRYFNGYIDNFRISNKAIYTPNLYSNGLTLPDENFNVSAYSNNDSEG